jgi:hypothetical protein
MNSVYRKEDYFKQKSGPAGMNEFQTHRKKKEEQFLPPGNIKKFKISQ